MKTIHVAAAVILHEDRLLATQRGYGNYKGWWEFPGGKVEAGESPEQALHREIREELDCPIFIERLFRHVEHDYPEYHVSMDCFLCHLGQEKPILKEHMAARWLSRDELFLVKWLGADYPVLEELHRILK